MERIKYCEKCWKAFRSNYESNEKHCVPCGGKKVRKQKTYNSVSYCSKCKKREQKMSALCTVCVKCAKSISNIYIITNPSWEGWVKIGKADDTHRRLASYQTCSPFRDYKVEFYLEMTFINTKIVENAFKDEFGDENGEWYNLSVEAAIEKIQIFKNEKLYNN